MRIDEVRRCAFEVSRKLRRATILNRASGKSFYGIGIRSSGTWKSRGGIVFSLRLLGIHVQGFIENIIRIVLQLFGFKTLFPVLEEGFPVKSDIGQLLKKEIVIKREIVIIISPFL